jgi:molecular chaperone DnaK (HSP70)
LQQLVFLPSVETDILLLVSIRFTDKEVQRDVKMFPFKVVNKDSKPCIEVELKDGKKVFQAEEISAMVLVKMKETAEAYLGKEIKNAVVTVPGASHPFIMAWSCLDDFKSETDIV